jgi:molybdopterin-guanine dinucleotide biosynthesis protein A
MIFGLVLAGGRSARFGADKALALLNGRSLFDASLSVLGVSCARLAVSVEDGGPLAEVAAARGLDRLADPPGAPRGPLAGVLSGLIWARAGGADLLATAPCDTPFLPADMVARLAGALAADDGAMVARAPDGLHPLCGVWRTAVAEPLAEALAGGAPPPGGGVLRRLGGRSLDFEDAAAFFNVNTREDLARAASGPGGTTGER